MKSLRAIAVFSLLTVLTGVTQVSAQGRSIPKGSEAQEAEAEALAEEVSELLPEGQKYRYKLFNGINISVDIFDPLMQLFAFDHGSYEGQVMVDLHHRFFPMASFGMGMANETSNNGLDYGTDKKQELNYKSSLAPFGKIGMAYNLRYNSTKPDDYYMLFTRYGVAYNKADITNLYYADDTWGSYGPVSIEDQEYTTHWLELGAMLKVQIVRHISLGWDLYCKFVLSQSGTQQGKPYYVPGYGTTDSNFGFSFRVYYDLF